jgi:RND family efflux transporter MFP subunit
LVLAIVVAVAAVTTWEYSLRHAGTTAIAAREQAADASGVASDNESRATDSETPLLQASGYVVALRETTVSAKSIYKVERLFVQEGQTVRKGQVIARLDDSNARAALDQSRAQVRQAEASLAAATLAAADAHPTYLRNEQEMREGLISPEAFDEAKAAYDAATAAVRVAQQTLEVARAAVALNQSYERDTVITAPFSGVVTSTNAQAGDLVSPQFSGGGGICTLVDMGSLEVDVDVSESFITRVHPGQRATIALDAYPSWQIPARVVAIVPTADRSTATVKVRVALLQEDSRILPQMGARVSFLSGPQQK